jgi:small-conductance mechanosensitive channel
MINIIFILIGFVLLVVAVFCCLRQNDDIFFLFTILTFLACIICFFAGLFYHDKTLSEEIIDSQEIVGAKIIEEFDGLDCTFLVVTYENSFKESSLKNLSKDDITVIYTDSDYKLVTYESTVNNLIHSKCKRYTVYVPKDIGNIFGNMKDITMFSPQPLNKAA